ncbi:MAG: DksA/TraR family C4-type zinc finger protein [Myxococcales bacterium]|nr:DksA/TraR family C4-type zinc finger protein [Myxococcales bacterium]
MAKGFVNDDAVHDQIDATVSDAVEHARRQLRRGRGLTHCEECDAPIPPARREAVPGVRLCVTCQADRDRDAVVPSLYNRRGNKDSQLR